MFSLFEVLGGIVLSVVFGGLSILILNKYNKFTPEKWLLLTTGMGWMFVIISILIFYLYEYLVGVF